MMHKSRELTAILCGIIAMMSLVSAQTWQAGPNTGFQFWRFDGEYFPGTNKVYFLGGRLASGSTDGTIWSFDPVSRVYAQTGATMPVPVSNYDICLLRDDYNLPAGDTYGLYVFGGRNDAGGFVNTVQVYRPRSNTVATLPSDTWPGKTGSYVCMPGAAVVINNKAYVTGGFQSTGAPYLSRQTWVFDPLAPAGSRWTRLLSADLPRERAYPLGAVIDSFFYAIGGDTFDGSSLYARSECWRLDTRSPGSGWQQVASLPQPCGEARAFGFNSNSPYGYYRQIITAGRGNWPDEDSLCFIFKADSNVWRPFPPLLRGRRNHAGTFIHGMGSTNGIPGLWVFGGRYDSDPNVWQTSEYWQLTWVDVHDVGCTKILIPAGTLDSGAVVIPACSVYNYGNQTESYTVRMKIGTGYNSTATVTGHTSGEYRYVTFPAWTAGPRGVLAITCSTELAGDNNNGNDKATGSVSVRVIDAQAVAITVPSGTVDSGTSITPRATVRNNGTEAVTFDVRFDIGTNYTSTQTVTNLAPNASASLNFDPWIAGPRGILNMKCTTMLAGDLIAANDIVTGSVNVAVHDIGAVAILVPSGAVAPGPVTPQVRVHNYGTAREAVAVTFQINDIPPYFETVTLAGGLPVGVDTMIEFPSWNAVSGSYTARCSTWLSTDQNRSNDTISTHFAVGNVDVGVVRIVAPRGSYDTSASIIPQATVRNFGEFASSFRVIFLIDEGSTYTDSAEVTNLAPGDTWRITFTEWAKPHPEGVYRTRCSTWLAGDGDPSNDVLADSFRIRIGGVPSETGWVQKADVPVGAKNKRVKDGGCLAYNEETDVTGYIYALKGNGRCEFYKYNTADNTWATKESIPAIGTTGKKKAVKKGASMTQADGKIYAVKGNGTLEFWCYDPRETVSYPWSELAAVPAGGKTIKEGSGATAVAIGDTTWVYFLKGSNTFEFYRYNVVSNTWENLPNAPGGASGKAFKSGSCLTYDGDKTIYALKGSQNELFAFALDSGVWSTKTPLPLIGVSGKKKKVKDGAGIAFHNGILYALKGGNTQEFWSYQADSDRWTQLADMPIGSGKKVKGGGALVYAPIPNVLYALKGNNTLEFWMYGFSSPAVARNCRPVNTLVGFGRSAGGFRLAVAPNPFTTGATIRYTVPHPAEVSLRLYDAGGRLVVTLVSGTHQTGEYEVAVPSHKLARGIYLLRLDTPNISRAQKLIIE